MKETLYHEGNTVISQKWKFVICPIEISKQLFGESLVSYKKTEKQCNEFRRAINKQKDKFNREI